MPGEFPTRYDPKGEAEVYRRWEESHVFEPRGSGPAFSIVLPPGISRYAFNRVLLTNASASISTATCGMFTSTGAGGVQIAAVQAITVTTAAADTNNNTMVLTLSNQNTTAFNDATLQFRIGSLMRSGP